MKCPGCLHFILTPLTLCVCCCLGGGVGDLYLCLSQDIKHTLHAKVTVKGDTFKEGFFCCDFLKSENKEIVGFNWNQKSSNVHPRTLSSAHCNKCRLLPLFLSNRKGFFLLQLSPNSERGNTIGDLQKTNINQTNK